MKSLLEYKNQTYIKSFIYEQIPENYGCHRLDDIFEQPQSIFENFKSQNMKDVKKMLCRMADLILFPVSIPMAVLFKTLRKNRFHNFPLFKKIFFWIGVYPVIDHYYEPLFNPKYLKHSPRIDRYLPGIDLNDKEQLELLEKFNYNHELEAIPRLPQNRTEKHEYCFSEGLFLSGDAEYLYNIIRFFKPRTMIEIGSGHSTLMARKALEKNRTEDSNYAYSHKCIEPFENLWLEELGIEIIRERVEDLDVSFFQQLERNDILFIDSSHMIRPQGDVLFEYLTLLPSLSPGVIVHVHDIFTPKDYLTGWINNASFWNEQYLLEAFLTHNDRYKVIGALNYLMHHHSDMLSAKCPVLQQDRENGIEREPGSFWLVKQY